MAGSALGDEGQWDALRDLFPARRQSKSEPGWEQAWIESLKPSAKAIALTLKFPINFLLLALFVIAATCAIVLSVVRQRQDAGICPTPRGG
jgi:hypothetical protein